MIISTYAQAKQNLDLVLEKANQDGEVKIESEDDRVFVVRP
jgi:hypothetical protein